MGTHRHGALDCVCSHIGAWWGPPAPTFWDHCSRGGQVDSDSFEDSIIGCRFFDSSESILDSRESITRIDASSESTSIAITELRKNNFSLSKRLFVIGHWRIGVFQSFHWRSFPLRGFPGAFVSTFFFSIFNVSSEHAFIVFS